jgi:hypothetical protein
MADKNYNLALKITADTAAATSAVKSLTEKMKGITGAHVTAAADAGSSAFGRMRSSAGSAFSGIMSAAGGAAAFMKTAFSFALSAVMSGLKYLGIAAASAMGAVYAAFRAIQPAADMEQYKIQLEVMVGVDEAKNRLAYLREFAAKTPFELPQVIEANNLMQAFGIFSKRALTAAGDAASAFGKDLSEVVRSLNYLAAGRGGEAFESLARMGITRDKLKPMGIKFSASGELESDTKQAFDAVISYMEQQFGGMMDRQSRTFKGAFSNVKDAIFNAFADGAKGILQYLVPALQTASSLINTIGAQVSKFDWSGIGEKFLAGFNTAAQIVAEMTANTERGKEWRAAFSDTAGAMIKHLSGFPSALATSLGGAIGGMISGLSTVSQLLIVGMAGMFTLHLQRLGEMLKGVWDGMTNKLQDVLTRGGGVVGTPEWKQARGEIEPQKSAAMVAFVKEQRANGVSDYHAQKNALKFIAPKFDQQIEERAKDLRYGTPTMTPAQQSLDAAMKELGGGNGLGATINALKGIGQETMKAAKTGFNAPGGVADWMTASKGIITGGKFGEMLTGEYSAQMANGKAQTAAYNAAPPAKPGEWAGFREGGLAIASGGGGAGGQRLLPGEVDLFARASSDTRMYSKEQETRATQQKQVSILQKIEANTRGGIGAKAQ